MTDAERAAHARKFFARLLAEFLEETETVENGSFTVHFQGRRPRNVEWRLVKSVDRWTENDAA